MQEHIRPCTHKTSIQVPNPTGTHESVSCTKQQMAGFRPRLGQ